MTRQCGVCGAPARPAFVAPPPELAPDLDLRPGEPTRSTLARWMQTCRSCGLSAPDLVEPPARARDSIGLPGYRAVQGPAAAFLRHAFLCEAGGETAEAAGSVLQAAWTLDDAGADATALRRRAAGLMQRDATGQDALRLVDVWRRAGAWAEARAQAEALLAAPELTDTDAAVLRYQLDLIGRQDGARHLMSSALRPPAQRPHVTHGRTVPKGFWQRLTGR